MTFENQKPLGSITRWFCVGIALLGTSLTDSVFSQDGQGAVDKAAESETQTVDISEAEKATGVRLAKTFFEKCMANEVDELYEMFDESLQAEVDVAMLKTFAAAIRNQLGKQQIMGTPTYQNLADDPKSFGLVTDAMFEKGLCQPSFSFQGEKLVGFNIDSEQLNGWFTGVDSVDEYRDRGLAFIKVFIEQNVEQAFNMVHPVLQEDLVDGKLAAMIQAVTERLGPVKSVEFARPLQEINDDYQKLYLYYTVVGENETMQAELTFQFAGMKGHFVGFTFK